MENCSTILIVEDSSTQAFEVQGFLEKEGFAVFIAHTGKDALKIIKTRKPSIIISDIVMPEMDGYELCKTIKGDDELKNIPFILLTDLSDTNDVIKGLSANADDFIIKPYDHKQLLCKIKLLLAWKENKESDGTQNPIEISIDGENFHINANKNQILRFLISTYDNVIHKNDELKKTQNDLKSLNEQLETKIKDIALSEEKGNRTTRDLQLHFVPKEKQNTETGELNKKMGDGQYEILGIRKNGDEFFAEASISQLKEEEGKIFTVVLRDITKRKTAEVELIKYKEQLENLVEERTKELRSTYDHLLHSEKLSAAGKLSASVAHEFNNPIFGIRNVLEIIKENINENKELCDFTNMAINECDRMSTLIEKLRDFHRPSTGKRKLIDIHTAIDDTLFLTKINLESKKIKIEKDYAIDIPQIKVVSDQIKQVMLNLITNAAHAITSPEGGTINLKTEARESGITISVKDDGIGINTQDIDSIFDPFFSTKAVKSTGLGLSISHTIIKEHGGSIAVSSEPGKGTTFTIILPINKK